jgi:hypothetical protein
MLGIRRQRQNKRIGKKNEMEMYPRKRSADSPLVNSPKRAREEEEQEEDMQEDEEEEEDEADMRKI